MRNRQRWLLAAAAVWLLALFGWLFLRCPVALTEVPFCAIVEKKAAPLNLGVVPPAAEGLAASEPSAAYRGFFWDLEAPASAAGLPVNFRTADGAFRNPPLVDPAFPQDAVPSRKGLETLRASGSAEFSEQGLAALVQELRRHTDGPIYIVDLRQESHGFLDGNAVGWCGLRDWGNLGRSDDAVIADEEARLQGTLGRAVPVVMLGTERYISDVDFVLVGQDRKLRETGVLQVTEAKTEQALVEAAGLRYARFFATDVVWPRAEVVDAFVAFVRDLPAGAWLHFRCRVGSGRTTSFLVMYDMMRNPDVACDDILLRQYLLGGMAYGALRTPSRGADWKAYYGNERSVMVRKFYEYVQENHATRYAVPWSVWLADHIADVSYR